MTTQQDVEPQSDQADGSTEETETLTTEAPTLASLQATLAEKEALIAKLGNDLKARDGQRRKQSEMDNWMQDLAEGQKAQSKLFGAYLDALQKGDTDALPAQIAKIEQESGISRGQRQRQARYEDSTAKLREVITGEADAMLLTEAQGVEIQQSWLEAGKQAFASGDFTGLHDVIIEASKMVTRNEREARAKDQKEAKESTKKALEKAGAFDLSIGGSASGGGRITSWAAAQKIKKVGDLSTSDYEKLVVGSA